MFEIFVLVTTVMASSFFGGLREYPGLLRFAEKVNFVLGSGSFTRKMILSRHGFRFDVIKADIDEKAIGNRSPEANPGHLVELLAHSKADAVLRKISDLGLDPKGILLTADQVVVHENHILEKPVDESEARKFISLYNGNQCSTVGSIALTDLKTKTRICGTSTATIHFRVIPDEIIDQIVAEGVCVQCAGGLMVEHELLQPYISHIDGTVDSVMGLSCDLLESLLNSLSNSSSSQT